MREPSTGATAVRELPRSVICAAACDLGGAGLSELGGAAIDLELFGVQFLADLRQLFVRELRWRLRSEVAESGEHGITAADRFLQRSCPVHDQR